MKNFTLTISLLLITLFSFAGGCGVSASHFTFDTEEGKSARLTFTLDNHCYPCTGENPVWFKHNGSSFVPINKATNGQWDVSEPGVYRVEVCGSIGTTIIEDGAVFTSDPIDEKPVTKFSVYPNPTTESNINLLVPDAPVSLETNTYKIALYNVLGTEILKKDNLVFGTGNYPLNLQGQGKGIFMLRIESGEEVKVVKILLR